MSDNDMKAQQEYLRDRELEWRRELAAISPSAAVQELKANEIVRMLADLDAAIGFYRERYKQ